MAANLLCLTAGGGIPVFCRTRGNAKQLPFPVVGSLNGVHMFCETNGIDLQSCLTDDAKVIWKNFCDSITLIIVTQDDIACDLHLTQILELVFNSMVLLYGLDDLSNIKNVERFKRDIRVCYPLLDRILASADSGSLFADLTGAVDVIMAPENAVLQTYLDAFMEAASSPFGFLMVSGSVAVATTKWWEMNAMERVVLTLLVSSLPTCSSRDVPVFLPVTSPKVPHRLMTFTLVADVELCVVCGPSPSLSELHSEVVRFWKTAVESLTSLSRQFLRRCPQNITLDKNLLGFMLENTETGVCLSTTCPSKSPDLRLVMNSAKRSSVLRNFYKHVIGNIWHKHLLGSSAKPGHGPSHLSESERLLHVPTDTYVCAETHKCYAVWTGNYRFIALYTTGIPTYAMRSVTHRMLETIAKDKNVTL